MGGGRRDIPLEINIERLSEYVERKAKDHLELILDNDVKDNKYNKGLFQIHQ